MIVAKNGPMVLTLEDGKLDPTWHIYDTLAEVDAAIAAARAAGARITSPGNLGACVDRRHAAARSLARTLARNRAARAAGDI